MPSGCAMVVRVADITGGTSSDFRKRNNPSITDGAPPPDLPVDAAPSIHLSPSDPCGGGPAFRQGVRPSPNKARPRTWRPQNATKGEKRGVAV
jgi:hypothetical protein